MASGYFRITSASANTGLSVTASELLDGDGNIDLIIGGFSNDDGEVLVVRGRDGPFDSLIDGSTLVEDGNGLVIDGPVGATDFGGSVLGAAAQKSVVETYLFVSDPENGDVYLYYTNYGGSAPFEPELVATYETGSVFGTLTLATIGDPGIGTLSNFVIGDPSGASGSGVVYYTGQVNSGISFPALPPEDIPVSFGDFTTTTLTFTGAEADRAGTDVAGVGDLDGDNADDLIIGAPGNGLNPGRVYVVFPQDDNDGFGGSYDLDTLSILPPEDSSSVAQGFAIIGETAGDLFGYRVAGSLEPGFSLNGDAERDIVIAAPLADNGGNPTGSVYLLFGDGATRDRFANMDMSNLGVGEGVRFDGLSVNERLGTDVVIFGDVSGDGIQDLGILNGAGDLYIVFGGATLDDATTFDLSTLDGTNGFIVTNIFGPSIELDGQGMPMARLEDIGTQSATLNNDSIDDIAIAATFGAGDAGTGETFVILGGLANLTSLDAADGASDGTIDFAEITGDVPFQQTGGTLLGGDRTDTVMTVNQVTNGTLTPTDGPNATGNVTITSGTGSFLPTAQVVGSYGVLTFTRDLGDPTIGLWEFDPKEIDDENPHPQDPTIIGLSGGEFVNVTETLVVTDDGSAITVTVTIQGIDDDPITNVTPVILPEDQLIFTGSISIEDPDADQTPSFAGATGEGLYGRIEVSEDGTTYTFTQTNADAQAGDSGDLPEDFITLTADDGTPVQVSITINSAPEPGTTDGTAGDDEIFTAFGDDIVNADDGDDRVDSGAGDDTVNGGAGDDTITDPLGDDTVDAGDDNDSVELLSGDNDVDGGTGADLILTGYGNDTVNGGDDNDLIAADHGANFLFGNDIVDGGAGDDIMSAGLGADTFRFASGGGNDEIGRFDPDNVVLDAGNGTWSFGTLVRDYQPGLDVVELSGFDPGTVNATTILGLITNVGGSAQFDDGAGNTLTFTNVLASELTVDDFVFII
ncbi:MAG: VCBS domain-containing protein [Rubricella sp.]